MERWHEAKIVVNASAQAAKAIAGRENSLLFIGKLL